MIEQSTDALDELLVRRLLTDLHTVRQYLACADASIPSSTGIVCDVLQTGVTGDGCSARYSEAGREMRRLPPKPIEHRRLFGELASSLHHTLRVYLVASPEVYDLSADHPKCAGITVVQSDKRRQIVPVSLAQRVAWIRADAELSKRWAEMLVGANRKQALDAMRRAGSSALLACAKEWAG